MNRRKDVVVGTLLLGMVFLSAGSLAQNTFTEDFTTTTYKDVDNTTADWNTTDGELKFFPYDPHLVGSATTAGGALNLTVAGDLLFVAEDNAGLQIFDITDPTNPGLVSTLGGLGFIQGLAVSGDHAYLADEASGLHVVDISNPALPGAVGSLPTTGPARDVVVSGDLLFLADGLNGLVVVDITNPAVPVQVGHYSTPDEAWDVAVAGNTAFVADDETGLVVLDILDPTNPVLLSVYNTPGSANGVKVAGDLVFVADNDGGLQVIDVTDLANPVLADSYDTPGQAYDVDVSGDLAYVADRLFGLAAIDVTDPTNLTLAFSMDTPGFASGVEVFGIHVFVADFTSGLQVYEVGSSLNMVLLNGVETSGQAGRSAVAGNLAFVADGDAGVQVIDITDLSSPYLVGNFGTTGEIVDVAADGDLIFLADPLYGLWVVDVSDPALPTYVGDINLTGSCSGLAVAGDLVLAATGTGGLQVIDVSDPANPASLGLLPTAGTTNRVTVAGDLALVAAGESGLQVIDISDPAVPVLLGGYDTPGIASDVAVAGDLAFVADGDSGLQIIDITDPGNPAYVGGAGGVEFFSEIALTGNLALAVDTVYGLVTADVSDPGNPYFLTSLATPEASLGVAVSGDLAFLGAGTSGWVPVQVIQREVDLLTGAAQSLVVDGATDRIIRCRLTSVPTYYEEVRWELSGDGGFSWGTYSPGIWKKTPLTGTDLLWRSWFRWDGANPVVSEVTLEWLNDYATINSISDVPDDQGGWVRVNFMRSGYDFYDESDRPVTGYWVHQRVEDQDLLAQVTDLGVVYDKGIGQDEFPELHDLGEVRHLAGRTFIIPREQVSFAMPPGVWEVVGSAPAMQQEYYTVRVPTLADSTSSGTNWSTYVVTTHTTPPTSWYASYPDSGYSIDNIAPGVPQGLSALYTPTGVTLDWVDAPEPDFQYHRVYRGTDPGFVPSPANLVEETVASGWIDSTPDPWGFHYKVTTLDHAGNESEPGSPNNLSGVQDIGVPLRTALLSAAPNPFNPSTKLSFETERTGNVRLKVFDAAGRLVRTLVDGNRAAGRHTVVWDGRDDSGEMSASGVYLYRLEAGQYRETKRMVLVK